jgi:hypothetical protein
MTVEPSNFGILLLSFGERPVNAFLAGRQLPEILNEGISPCSQEALWNAKNTCTLTLAWYTSHLLRQGNAEGDNCHDFIALLGGDIGARLLN